MSKRKRLIYDAIVAAGPEGIMPHTILKTIYGDQLTKGGGVVLRVQICELNKILAKIGQRIKGRRSTGYCLENL